MKKVYTAAFKAQVALDLLKEEKGVAQISAELASIRMSCATGAPKR
jgi:hypothetical protein